MALLEQVGTPSRNTNSKARSWCFTWNNYQNEDIGTLEHLFSINQYEYIFGLEVGESGTPHMQGVFRAKNPIYFSAVKKMLPKCHIEKCKNWNASKNYCAKDGKIYSNFEEEKKAPENLLETKLNAYMEKKYNGVVWRDWQKKILDIIATEPDERTVHWVWEPNGNAGKSFLAKYIIWKHKAVIVNGKQNDVFNGIKTYLEQKQDYMDIVIIDIPRVNKDYVCYGTMEKIKDGLFYSGKYEGGQILLTPCHLIVFANFEPELGKMSIDRWNIIRIES